MLIITDLGDSFDSPQMTLLSKGFGNYSVLKKASGGKVCHLESRLRMRFPPRSSGKITSAFDLDWPESVF